MSEAFDLLVSGGRVLDPATGVDAELDVGITGGRIAAIAPKLPRSDAKKTLDARSSYVTPGLLDLHIHSYWGVNPYGFSADPLCLASGVTTAVDAGSSGPVNFPGFVRLVHEQSRARMLAFVALAQHGVLNDPGELENLRFADPEGAAERVKASPDVAVGIKVRLHKKAVGEHGREALQLAIKAGEACRAPVMVHIGNTGLSLEEIVEALRPGDIVTHCYTPQKPAIIDDRGRLREAVRKARERHVLFDVGHANGHFDFNIVRRAIDAGLIPDAISSDLHGRMGLDNPVIDLPTTMTKFLALGLRLEEVIAACTSQPARAIGWQDRIGSLAVGREADLAILQVVNDYVELRDTVGGELIAEHRVAVRATIRSGEVFQGKG